MSFKDVLSTLKRVFTDSEPNPDDYLDPEILELGSSANIQKIINAAEKRRNNAVVFAKDKNTEKNRQSFVEKANHSKTPKKANNTVKKAKDENERE